MILLIIVIKVHNYIYFFACQIIQYLFHMHLITIIIIFYLLCTTVKFACPAYFLYNALQHSHVYYVRYYIFAILYFIDLNSYIVL